MNTTTAAAPKESRGGALAPLAIPVFRALWLAVLISNIGSWMQTVGAQWLLINEHASPAVVALVQTAASLPVLLIGIPAGVIGEFSNRRRLLIWVQAFHVAVGVLLTVLTTTGSMTPALLLVVTSLLGAASALQLPAYQALVSEIVPRTSIADAAALSSVGVNFARAVEPALVGLVIARLGVPFVFAANAFSFALFLVVLVAWRGYQRPNTRVEPFIDATRAGVRYIVHAGVVQHPRAAGGRHGPRECALGASAAHRGRPTPAVLVGLRPPARRRRRRISRRGVPQGTLREHGSKEPDST